jgi:hypothetical protein
MFVESARIIKSKNAVQFIDYAVLIVDNFESCTDEGAIVCVLRPLHGRP